MKNMAKGIKNIIYPKAGKIILVRYTPEGILSVNNDSLVGNTGVVERIESAIEIQTNDLPDGNSDWPMGSYDTGTNGSITVAMSNFNAKLYSALTGANYSPGMQDAQMWSADEEVLVEKDSDNKFTFKLGHTPAPDGSIVLVDEMSSPFVKVSGVPAAGQFSVSSNVLTFSSADEGKNLFATYDWVATEAVNLALPTLASRPVYQAIIETEATDKDLLKRYAANIVVDKCKADGSIAPPPQQRQAQGWSFSLKVLKPRNGKNPVYWRFTELN